MDFNYTKIKIGNWLYRHFFPLYNITYRWFKRRNDASEIALLEKLVKPGFHVLDIGANIGFYARRLSRLTGSGGRVYCFEPDSENFRRLAGNAGKLKNVTLFNKAVSDKSGSLKVYRSKLLNVDHRTYPVSNYDSIEETVAVAIDELISEGAVQKADLVKIDIQGYELAAFRGMERLLQSSSGLKILVEFWPHGFRRAGTSASAFYDFFDSRGYCFYVIEKALRPLAREEVAICDDKPFEYSFNVLIERK